MNKTILPQFKNNSFFGLEPRRYRIEFGDDYGGSVGVRSL
jgi:hypothetical protein